MIKYLKNSLQIIAFVSVLFFVSPQHIQALTGIKVAPLLYHEHLIDSKKVKAFIDVSNPNDSSINVKAHVQGFSQASNDGDLVFFESKELQKAIELDYEEFTLEPREAMRLYFSVDPKMLPPGGVNGVIFFKTTLNSLNQDSTSIRPAANVGTLLILQNGDGDKKAVLEKLSMPMVQVGSNLKASVAVGNRGTNNPVAFFPEIAINIQPYRASHKERSSLIFPGRTRTTNVSIPGNFLGIIRLKAAVGSSAGYRWAFVAVGSGRWIGLAIVILAVIAALGGLYFRRMKQLKNK